MSDKSNSISDRCAYGHSYEKHINEFKDLGLETPEQYKEHIRNVLENKETECFSAYSTKQPWRQADIFYHEPTNTQVVSPENPNNEPTGHRPDNGRKDFDKKYQEAERIEDREIEKYHGIDELEKAKQADLSRKESEQATLKEDRDVAATVMEREEVEQAKDLDLDNSLEN